MVTRRSSGSRHISVRFTSRHDILGHREAAFRTPGLAAVAVACQRKAAPPDRHLDAGLQASPAASFALARADLGRSQCHAAPRTAAAPAQAASPEPSRSASMSRRPSMRRRQCSRRARPRRRPRRSPSGDAYRSAAVGVKLRQDADQRASWRAGLAQRQRSLPSGAPLRSVAIRACDLVMMAEHTRTRRFHGSQGPATQGEAAD
jgi:hypothetical protein